MNYIHELAIGKDKLGGIPLFSDLDKCLIQELQIFYAFFESGIHSAFCVNGFDHMPIYIATQLNCENTYGHDIVFE